LCEGTNFPAKTTLSKKQETAVNINQKGKPRLGGRDIDVLWLQCPAHLIVTTEALPATVAIAAKYAAAVAAPPPLGESTLSFNLSQARVTAMPMLCIH